MSAGSATAYESTGCAAANRGSMNVNVAAGSTAMRRTSLDEGEALTLNIATRGTAVISVSGGDGATQTLHSGQSTSVLFNAPSAGSYNVHVDADRHDAVQLNVRCLSAAKASAERALLDRRKALLTERDPDRIRIDRPSTTPKPLDAQNGVAPNGEVPREVTASVSASELAAAMKLGQPHEPGILDFWFEGRYLTYDTVDMNARQNDGNFSVMYFGSKYMLGPDIMLGYLAQFDQAGEGLGDGSKVSASGWMAGPYMSVRFGQGVIFDGRAAWGTAQNLPSGVALDTTSADRSLLRGTLRGTRQVGGWTVAPSVGLSYVEDTPIFQGTALSDPAATPTGTGRLDVLPEIKRRFDINSEAYIEPRVAAGGFLAFDNLSEIAPGGAAMAAPDLHWKAEAGVAVGVKDSMNLQATGGVESAGQAATDNWMGKLQLNVPLNK
jgi:hypothetical protein